MIGVFVSAARDEPPAIDLSAQRSGATAALLTAGSRSEASEMSSDSNARRRGSEGERAARRRRGSLCRGGSSARRDDPEAVEGGRGIGQIGVAEGRRRRGDGGAARGGRGGLRGAAERAAGGDGGVEGGGDRRSTGRILSAWRTKPDTAGGNDPQVRRGAAAIVLGEINPGSDLSSRLRVRVGLDSPMLRVYSARVRGEVVVLEGVALPDGTAVTIAVNDESKAMVELAPAELADLDEAIAEADRSESVSSAVVLAELGRIARPARP
jgi:hypothetical protein